jgi:hypothetical protein
MLIVELAIPFTRLVRAKNMVDSTAFSNLSGGQFTPESSGQFDPKWGGQFRPEQVVSLNRIGVVSFTEFSKFEIVYRVNNSLLVVLLIYNYVFTRSRQNSVRGHYFNSVRGP